MDKTKALQVIDSNQGKALMFARREEIEEVSQQYEPIVTVLQLDSSQFADVGMGNMYPMKSATNQIADASGVSFTTNCGTKEKGSWADVRVHQEKDGSFSVSGDFAIVGWAQGQRLKPDGKLRTSSVREYEFNVVDRANLDFVNDADKPNDRKKYSTLAKARKHLLELKKFATQRASTGAELAVVRELAGVPTAFKKGEVGKPMLFSQIIESNKFKMDVAEKLMKTPDGRQAVAGALFNTTAALYGNQTQQIDGSNPAEPRDVSPETEGEPQSDQWADEPEPQQTGEDPRERLVTELEAWLNSNVLSEKGREIVRHAVNNSSEYSVEKLEEYVQKCKAAADNQGGAA